MLGKLLAGASAMLLASCASVNAQETGAPDKSVTPQAWAETCEPWDEWDKPAPPYRIHGNTYYVGTCGIASILLTDKTGHIVIDSGTEAGAEIVIANIATLGFDIKDVKILLSSHEHFDHVGGMAKLQRASGAKVVASIAAAPVLSSGNLAADDPQAGMHDAFESMIVSQEIAGEQALMRGHYVDYIYAIETPGHSPGALTWVWESCENKVCKTIVYADSLSPVSAEGYKFSDRQYYVNLFRQSIGRVGALDCDILLTPHPSHSKMVKRAATGSFEGGISCWDYAKGKMRDLDKRLAKEAAEATSNP
jgi:metallo-beta-lactamase class B